MTINEEVQKAIDALYGNQADWSPARKKCLEASVKNIRYGAGKLPNEYFLKLGIRLFTIYSHLHLIQAVCPEMALGMPVLFHVMTQTIMRDVEDEVDISAAIAFLGSKNELSD
jgi:hypothetical protein